MTIKKKPPKKVLDSVALGTYGAPPVEPDETLCCLECGCEDFKLIWSGILDSAVIECKECKNRDIINIGHQAGLNG